MKDRVDVNDVQRCSVRSTGGWSSDDYTPTRLRVTRAYTLRMNSTHSDGQEDLRIFALNEQCYDLAAALFRRVLQVLDGLHG